jgi:hypothetical protein
MNLPAFKKPTEATEGVDAILYGPPKSGKTSTLDDPNFKILIVDVDGGSSVLANAKNTELFPATTWEEVCEIGESFKRGYFNINGQKVPTYHDLLAFDSLTRLQDLCKEYIVNRYAPNRKREIAGKFGGLQDWGDLKSLMTDIVKEFHGLTKRGDKSIHIMWLAHVDFVTDPDAGSKILGTKIMMQGKETGDIIMSVVDSIFYMEKAEKDGQEHFFVRTRKSGYIDAGVRVPKNREKLAPAIKNPVWSEIFENMGYTRKGMSAAPEPELVPEEK